MDFWSVFGFLDGILGDLGGLTGFFLPIDLFLKCF